MRGRQWGRSPPNQTGWRPILVIVVSVGVKRVMHSLDAPQHTDQFWGRKYSPTPTRSGDTLVSVTQAVRRHLSPVTHMCGSQPNATTHTRADSQHPLVHPCPLQHALTSSRSSVEPPLFSSCISAGTSPAFAAAITGPGGAGAWLYPTVINRGVSLNCTLIPPTDTL